MKKINTTVKSEFTVEPAGKLQNKRLTFESPYIEIISFNAVDVITSSGFDGDGDSSWLHT